MTSYSTKNKIILNVFIKLVNSLHSMFSVNHRHISPIDKKYPSQFGPLENYCILKEIVSNKTQKSQSYVLVNISHGFIPTYNLINTSIVLSLHENNCIFYHSNTSD